MTPWIKGLALSVLAASLLACGPKPLSEAERAQVAALKTEQQTVDQEIASAEADSNQYAGKISKALPETVFVYVSPKRRPEGGWTPPMVLDHGKALLFIEPGGQDEDAPALWC